MNHSDPFESKGCRRSRARGVPPCIGPRGARTAARSTYSTPLQGPLDVVQEQPQSYQEKHNSKEGFQGSRVQSLIESDPEPGSENRPREQGKPSGKEDVPGRALWQLRVAPPGDGIGYGRGQCREDNDAQRRRCHFLHLQPNQVNEKGNGNDPSPDP